MVLTLYELVISGTVKAPVCRLVAEGRQAVAHSESNEGGMQG